MKKTVLSLLLLVMIVLVSGCGANKTTDKQPADKKEETDPIKKTEKSIAPYLREIGKEADENGNPKLSNEDADRVNDVYLMGKTGTVSFKSEDGSIISQCLWKSNDKATADDFHYYGYNDDLDQVEKGYVLELNKCLGSEDRTLKRRGAAYTIDNPAFWENTYYGLLAFAWYDEGEQCIYVEWTPPHTCEADGCSENALYRVQEDDDHIKYYCYDHDKEIEDTAAAAEYEQAKKAEEKKGDEPNNKEEVKPAPTIGMSTYDVKYNSSWGEPNRIKKETTAYGVSEQWVYDNNRYLYFEDDILTTIQE